ncbi:adenosine kinase [Babesia ovata]|uniref:Adenosine kinase n=1 Tax=Babesia ovata TaxID=189622 RepID=A0A2H6KKJ0_9APIC|nr:adenosine kinase [Babesia ovata]GBE63497.1 adenosine kinase [Babesia ovata]
MVALKLINLFSVLVASLAFASEDNTGNDIIQQGPSRLLFAGNPIIDIYCRVNQDVIDELGFRKAESNRISPEVFKMLGERLKVDSKNAGGSSANTARSYAFVGGDATFFGLVGDDDLADTFEKCMIDYGVKPNIHRKAGEFTSQVYSLVTPNAERNMYLLFGASRLLNPECLPGSIMDDFDYYVVNGFIFGSPSIAAFSHKMIDETLRRGKKLITLLANMVCIRRFSNYLRPIVEKSDIIAGNIDEFTGLYQIKEREELFKHFENLTSGDKPKHTAVIITMSEEGAYIIARGKRCFIPPSGVEAIDTTGAGDFFAGAAIYGLLHGYTVRQSGELAVAMAGDIIGHMGTLVTDGLRNKIDAIKAIAKSS